jgi:hypothetical protein
MDYQCWFCSEAIERSDKGAILISVQSLWRYDSGSVTDDDPMQDVYAHSACGKARLRGSSMDLEPEVFCEDA